jgi:hypothetical protein
MATTKDIELQGERLLNEYTYAAVEDLKNEWSDAARFNDIFTEHYSNVIAEKTAKKTKLTPVFKIQSCFKTVFGLLFSGFMDNLSNINITSNSSITDLIEEFDTLDEDYGKFIFMSAGRSLQMGKCLQNAYDAKKYFHAKIEAMMPQHRSNMIVMTLIVQTFDTFMKYTALEMANHAWYDNKTGKNGFSSGFIIALMAGSGMRLTTANTLLVSVEEIIKAVIEAAPKKQRGKKAVKGVAANTANTANAANASDTQSALCAPVTTTDVKLSDQNISDYIGNLNV